MTTLIPRQCPVCGTVTWAPRTESFFCLCQSTWFARCPDSRSYPSPDQDNPEPGSIVDVEC